MFEYNYISPASSTSILFFERLYEYRFMKPHLFL